MATRTLLRAAPLFAACLVAAGVPSCRGTDATVALRPTDPAADPAAAPAAAPTPAERLKLVTRDDARLGRIARGTFTVFENRAAASGRTLELDVVVLHARSAAPAPDPLFFLAGGPGQDATTLVEQWVDEPMREEHDVVLVSQRGTGGSMRLDCDPGNDADLQGYLGPMFPADRFRDCLAELSARADLTQYS